MYKVLSSLQDKEYHNAKWSEALSDAQKQHDATPSEHRSRWLVIMGIIRQAIERGEAWPTEEEPDER